MLPDIPQALENDFRGEALRQFEERRRRAMVITGTGEPIEIRRPMPVRRYQPEREDRRPYAASRNPCVHCGTRGDIGCEHQRPFVAVVPDFVLAEADKTRRRHPVLFRKVSR